jgi:uncharacterized protein (TIGR01244 family)
MTSNEVNAGSRSWVRSRPSTLRRVRRVVALLSALMLVVTGAIYAKWDLLDGRLVTVLPGRMYQSAAMSPDCLTATLYRHGVRTVIDLRDVELEAVAAERIMLADRGIEHRHVPVPQEPDQEDVRRFLVAVATAPPPVLVHCKHGEGRSVLMCALSRIEQQGWSNADAWRGTARLPDSLRFLGELWPGLRCFAPTSPKGRIVLGYQRAGPGAPPR